MQNHVLNNNLNTKNLHFPSNAIIKDALGITSPYAADSDIAISQKQISILEDAIRRYERLEDVRKFTCLALDDIETVTEEDIKRALELENTVSIDNEQSVLNLIQNEGFLKDLESADFSEILASASDTLYRPEIEARSAYDSYEEDIFNPSDFDVADSLEDYQA